MRRALVVVVCGVLAGCGGERQDADEPSGEFKVEIVRASFPARQHIAQDVKLRLRVRNGSDRTLRTVAVTVETKPRGSAAPIAFGQASVAADLADPGRPVWVLDEGPKGGTTAYVNTWLAGTLRAGESRELTWRLVATRAGTYTVSYRVAPGLTGKAEAAAGGRTSGTFDVTIDGEPVPARVGDDGSVERGASN
ncbi:MAG TPA: hypothetical protein VFG79_19370 [Solirubrobacter sp.]|nr:hypothetical protein [Solirubrobacter sp.]